MPPDRSDVLDKISALNEGDPGVDAGDVRDTISAFNEANEGKPGFGPTPVSEAEPPDVEVVGEYGSEQPGPTNTPGGQNIPDPSPSLPEPGSVGGTGQQPGPTNTPSGTEVMDPSPDTEEVVGESIGRQPSPQVTNNTTTTDKGPSGTTSGTSPVVGEDIGQTPDNTIGITSTDSSIDGMGMGLDPKLIIGAVVVALLAFAR